MKLILLIYTVLLFQLFDITSAEFLECAMDSDCIAEKATCIDNICQCPQGQVFSTDGLACLSIAIGINAQCVDDRQCAWLLGKYRCYRGECNCEEGWRYYHGRCLNASGLSEHCNTDQDCFNGYDILAMKCDEGVCSCNTGYYLRGDYDCRPEATTIADYCSLNSDCKIENSMCVASYCVIPSTKQNYPKQSQDDEHFSSSKIALGTGYETPCNVDSDCEMNNSICYALTKTCICKRGYFLKSESIGCVGELGLNVSCTADEECKITPGRCIDGECYCRKTYFSAQSNNACQKPMTQDNYFCNNAERCYVLGKEAICQTNECMCRTNAILNKDYVCQSLGGPGTEDCNDNAELCNVIINSICIDGRCECPEGYRLDIGACKPNLGAACDDDTKICEMENALCSNGICQCGQNYTESGDTTCLKLANGLGDPCDINKQCSEAFKYSECKDEQCACISGFIISDDICKAEKWCSRNTNKASDMGDTCTTEEDCHVMLGKGVQCRNNICQCSADEVPSANRKDCASGSEQSLLLNTGLMTSLTMCLLFLHLLMYR